MDPGEVGTKEFQRRLVATDSCFRLLYIEEALQLDLKLLNVLALKRSAVHCNYGEHLNQALWE